MDPVSWREIPTLPESETDEMLEVLEGIFENGAPIPNRVSNRMLLGAIRKQYRLSAGNRNSIRSLWVAVGGLGAGVVALGYLVSQNSLDIARNAQAIAANTDKIADLAMKVILHLGG